MLLAVPACCHFVALNALITGLVTHAPSIGDLSPLISPLVAHVAPTAGVTDSSE